MQLVSYAFQLFLLALQTSLTAYPFASRWVSYALLLFLRVPQTSLTAYPFASRWVGFHFVCSRSRTP